MYACDLVDTDYVKQADFVFVAEVEVAVDAQTVFACFEDAQSWPKWTPAIKEVIWTSEKPFDIGTTRTVNMIGMKADESFIAWDYPKHMSFCFTHCSQKMVRSFAEDYRVEPLDNGLTKVTWVMAMTPQGIGRYTMPLSRPLMRWAVQWMLNRFKKYIETEFTVPQGT